MIQDIESLVLAEVAAAACREVVHHENMVAIEEQPLNEVGAKESGPTCYENPHPPLRVSGSDFCGFALLKRSPQKAGRKRLRLVRRLW